MIPNKRLLLGLFHTYNNKYFDGILPMPSFKIRHTYKILGYFSCDVGEDGTIYNPCIEVSDNYDYFENQLEDIMVHEMIHYYLAFTGSDIRCSHGKEFSKMACSFNSKYHLNIRSRIDLSEYSIREGKSRLMFTLSTLF